MMRVHNSDGVTFGSDYSSNTLLFLINTQTTGVLRVNERGAQSTQRVEPYFY